jgi:hypothetical protein
MIGRVDEAVQAMEPGPTKNHCSVWHLIWSKQMTIAGFRVEIIHVYPWRVGRTLDLSVISNLASILRIMLISALFVIFSVIGFRGQPLGVTLTPVNDCSALPKYNNATNIAGPWTIRVNGCHNSTSPQGDCDIEGFAASCDVKRSAEEKSIQRGSVRSSVHRQLEAKH